MKKTFALILLACNLLHAADITVDNNPNAVADYTSLQSALDAASTGDRILVAGSATSYGNVYIGKNSSGSVNTAEDITIIGVGYLRADNGVLPDATGNNNSANFQISITGYRQTSPSIEYFGINGLTVIGCEISNLYSFGSSNSRHQNIVFDRCFFNFNGREDIEYVTNLTISRTIGECGLLIENSSSVVITNSCFEFLALNDGAIATHTTLKGVEDYFNYLLVLDTTASASNMVIDCRTQNTDHASTPAVSALGSLTHSIAIGNGALPTSATNFDNQTVTTVFAEDPLTNPSNLSADAIWKLNTSGSNPALTGANDGGEMGAFGGSSPYNLSGLPGAPQIIQLNVPAVVSPTTGLDIEVEVQQTATN